MKCKTAGESHGQGILALIEGFPAGITINTNGINAELQRRQGGYGRGGRQKLETDSVEILTGIWRGKSTGAPITLWVKNKDFRIDEAPDLFQPRPGHADLPGSIKYNEPIRPILERSSARETAARVAAGALAKQYLAAHGINIIGFVKNIGGFLSDDPNDAALDYDTVLQRRTQSEFYTLHSEHDDRLKSEIDRISAGGDSVGGIIEVRIFGVPIGLGSCMQWDMKLDGKLAQAVMSVQAQKGVEIGLGFASATTPGSQMHDPIGYDAALQDTSCQGFTRPSNNAGGIEGGMSNGQPIIIRSAMKPIPTLQKPLDSVDLRTKEAVPTFYERSDVCAVPAGSVVIENVAAMTIAECLAENKKH
ncbi:MAG: chorismate synthase [Planctomycetaceae bacterium]|jgi:chorismate synthase|nr:chorismate synthase [Planctomycetaceae bacterium]